MEVLFFSSGLIGIGYTLNHQHQFPFLINNKKRFQELGAHQCKNHLKATYVHKAFKNCEGFFIRKKNWLKINEDHAAITESFQEELKKRFNKYIGNPLKRLKKFQLKKMS